MKVKAVFFDWGRTLHDPETDSIFKGAPEILERISGDFILVLISLAKSQTPDERRNSIEKSGIAKYFNKILVGGENKDDLYEKIVEELNLKPEEIIIVDDRTVRGIKWGNKVGAKTIWFRNGKYKDELPDQETGEPNHIIKDIRELEKLI